MEELTDSELLEIAKKNKNELIKLESNREEREINSDIDKVDKLIKTLNNAILKKEAEVKILKDLKVDIKDKKTTYKKYEAEEKKIAEDKKNEREAKKSEKK